MATWLAATASWGEFVARVPLADRFRGMEAANRELLRAWPDQAVWLLRRYGATVADCTDLNPPLAIHNTALGYTNLTILAGSHVGKGVLFDLADRITIGVGATISMRVLVITHIDVGRSPLREHGFPTGKAPVSIRDGAYIGAGAIILPGRTIGVCSVVGAGAGVTHDVPDLTVVAGVPARVLRRVEPQ